MTTEEYENALDKLQKKYEKTLVELGKMEARYNREYDRAMNFRDEVDRLTTRNKSLTKQLHNARVQLYHYCDTNRRLIEVFPRLRQMSPEVAARMDEIRIEVDRIYDQRKSRKKPSAV